MNQKNKVTILLATFNRSHLIEDTLDSILAQTYTNWECFIIDDNSKDNTEAFLKENYLSKDSRFTFYKKPLHKYKKGLSDSRNFGLDLAKIAKAEYIQLFDDDDIMHPQKLELQMHPFIEDVNLDMSLCLYRKFHVESTIDFHLKKCNDNSCVINSDNLFWDFYTHKINLNSLGPIWKLTSLSNFRFDVLLKTSEERDFYLRIFLQSEIKYTPINEVLFWYRKHENTVTNGVLINDAESLYSLKRSQQKMRKMIFKSNKMSTSKRLKSLIKYFLNL